MSAYSISGLLIALSAFGFGLFVFLRSSDKRIGRLWFIFSLATTGWGLGILWIGLTKTESFGLLAWQTAYAFGVLWIAPIFYHFVCAFLGLKRTFSIRLNYFIAFLFLLFVPTRFFFARADFLFNAFYYIRGGSLYHVYIVWWMALVIFSHYELIKALKTVLPDQKKRIQYFFIATALGYTGGFHTYLPKIGFDFYPWGSFAVILYPIIMMYAILQFNLMDIRIFLRRAVLLVGIYVGLILMTLPLIGIVHSKAITSLVHFQSYVLIEVILGSLLFSAGPFLYALFIRRNSFFHEHSMAGLTHELKSPLAAIESALEQLNSIELGNPKTSKEKDYVEMIERNSIRLRKLVEDLLLTFRDPKALTQETSIKINLNELCQQVADEFRPEIESKDLVFTFSPSEKALFVQGDPSKLKQVVSNLLSNALKFTSEGKIQLIIKGENGAVTVEVKDTGLGIPADELPYIFDRFFRGRESKTRKGTGIGLTIAKAWVEAHGGKIWAESEGLNLPADRAGLPADRRDKGTTVIFTLPR